MKILFAVFLAILATAAVLGGIHLYFDAEEKATSVQNATVELIEKSTKLNLLKIQRAVSQEEKDAAILAYQADIDTVKKMNLVPRAQIMAAEMEAQLAEARTRPLSPTIP